MHIECRERTIEDLLKSDYYIIPSFQRPYSWEQQHVDDFWEDVFTTEAESSHFIGSMVMYQEDKQVAIVDGQQRMTTITIFLCVLRDKLLELGHEDLAKSLHNIYIEKENKDTKKYFTLDPGTSHPYFHNTIMAYPGSKKEVKDIGPEEQSLLNSYGFLKSKIEGVISSINDNPEVKAGSKQDTIKAKLIELRDKALDIRLVWIKLGNYLDAFTVFETLNTRGQDLELSHLIKNSIAKLLNTENPRTDIVSQSWDEIKDLFELPKSKIDFNSFIHHFWISRNKYITKQRLFREITSKVQNKDKATELLEQIKLDSKIYSFMHNPREGVIDIIGEKTRIHNSIHAINLFKAKMPFPLILSLLRGEITKKIKSGKVATALEVIENFHFINTAVTSQRSSGGVSMMYANLARELSQTEDPSKQSDILRQLHTKLQKLPKFEEFKVLFAEIEFTNLKTKNKNLVQYILRKIYSHLVKGYLAEEKLTIEHILPQSQANTPELRAAVGKVGNLILVTEELNQKLANKSFPDKLKILKAENDPVTKDPIFANATSWGVDEINKRTEYLAELSYNKIWQV